MCLTERAKSVLNNLELIDFDYARYYVMLSFADYNKTSLLMRKWINGDIEAIFDDDLDIDYTPDEIHVMSEVVKKAPIYILYYLERNHVETWKQNYFNEQISNLK